MNAAEVRTWPDDLEIDRKGLGSPRACAPTASSDQLDAVIVPGVAFDQQGGRLGRGGGFYDRFLVGVGVARRVGVCFSCQVVGDGVPMEPHDARVGVLVTPEGARTPSME